MREHGVYAHGVSPLGYRLRRGAHPIWIQKKAALSLSRRGKISGTFSRNQNRQESAHSDSAMPFFLRPFYIQVIRKLDPFNRTFLLKYQI